MWACCLSAGPRSDQLSEDPGLALLHVCAAVLPGVNVNNRHIYCSQGRLVCKYVSASRFDMCVQDDHPEGAQQYRASGNIVHVCERGQHGGEAVRPAAVRRLQPRQLQSSSHKTCPHGTAERYLSSSLCCIRFVFLSHLLNLGFIFSFYTLLSFKLQILYSVLW